MPRFVVCVPVEGAPSVAPCGDAGGLTYAPASMEFPVPGDVHFQNAELLFAYGFGAVLTVWLLGLAVGLILSLIADGQ